MKVHTMKALLAAACLSLSTIGATGAMATDNLYVTQKNPKLSAGQFVGNCAMTGGTPTNISSGVHGDTTINCQKKNGTSVTCSWADNEMICAGNGPRPQ